MNKVYLALFFAVIAVFTGFMFFTDSDKNFSNNNTEKDTIGSAKTMRIASIFENGDNIPAKYTCDGDDLNPALFIESPPAETKSFVLIVDDPDAPGRTFLHWTIWNIPPETREIKSGVLPNGATEGITDFGQTGYGGPCPPSGTHRYFFRLYALNELLDLPEGATLGELQDAMDGKILSVAEFMGEYARSK